MPCQIAMERFVHHVARFVRHELIDERVGHSAGPGHCAVLNTTGVCTSGS